MARVVSDAVHMQCAAIVNKAHDVLASSGRFNLQPTETMYQLVDDDVNIHKVILQQLIHISLMPRLMDGAIYMCTCFFFLYVAVIVIGKSCACVSVEPVPRFLEFART